VNRHQERAIEQRAATVESTRSWIEQLERSFEWYAEQSGVAPVRLLDELQRAYTQLERAEDALDRARAGYWRDPPAGMAIVGP